MGPHTNHDYDIGVVPVSLDYSVNDTIYPVYSSGIIIPVLTGQPLKWRFKGILLKLHQYAVNLFSMTLSNQFVIILFCLLFHHHNESGHFHTSISSMGVFLDFSRSEAISGSDKRYSVSMMLL